MSRQAAGKYRFKTLAHAGRMVGLAVLAAGAGMAGFACRTAMAQGGAPQLRGGIDPGEEHQRQLRDLQKVIEKSNSQRRKIMTELEGIRNDRARLNAALLEATAGIKNSENRIGELEQQFAQSRRREAGIRNSLQARRAVIAEILAALQRMGRRPPPAVLISPGDILRAVRTSILLGSVVPELRQDARMLVADLEELERVRAGIDREKANLKKQIGELGNERIRLAAILETRKGSIESVQGVLASEQQRAAELAAQATTLKNLIDRLESEIEAARKASQAARLAEQQRKTMAHLKPGAIANPFADRARLAPAIAFAQARGRLPLPVAGIIHRAYAEPDNFGGREKGLSIATNPNALVASPADGWVVYAGPYRSYGQLLIVNAGDGYYIVLTGMERLVVGTGQFVLAGEPVGSMGTGTTRTAATIAVGAVKPVLYIEFRKDGTAIDPDPWWVKPELEKVRG